MKLGVKEAMHCTADEAYLQDCIERCSCKVNVKNDHKMACAMHPATCIHVHMSSCSGTRRYCQCKQFG